MPMGPNRRGSLDWMMQYTYLPRLSPARTDGLRVSFDAGVAGALDRVRAALAQLPSRERKILGLYYFGDATMKQIGKQIGVNESRVSQLHARAIQRLRKILTGTGDAPGLKLVQKPRRAARMTSPTPAKRQTTRRRLHRVA